MNCQSNVHLCIVKYRELTISETFIWAHVERLPATVTVVQGWIPHVGTQPVLSTTLLGRLSRKIWRLLARPDDHWEITLAYQKVFRKSRAAAVLAEYGITGVRVMEACRRMGIPLIVHFHGFDASSHEVLKSYAETYPLLFQEAAAIIAVSRAMQKKLLSLGVPPEKVYYNPCGIDCQAFGGADPASAPPVFLAVGRFVEKKAPYLTLLAFAEVYRSCHEARLRMIGDGPLLSVCQDLAKALQIENAVTFLGAQPHSVVQEEMRQARAFVQHSVESSSGDSEGTPVGILEAGASGLPVLSTRHAGIPDVVLEGKTGFLVDERDVHGMAKYMLKLIQQPGLARELGQTARRRIETHFSMEQSISRLWSIIESCIADFSHNNRMKISLKNKNAAHGSVAPCIPD